MVFINPRGSKYFYMPYFGLEVPSNSIGVLWGLSKYLDPLGLFLGLFGE